MKMMKYILSILLVLWGLYIAFVKLFFVGIHFPFLTVITIIAIILGIKKHIISGLISFISACLWMVLSAETIGFVIFFDLNNFERMLIGIIPFLLGSGLMFFVQTEIKRIDNLATKFLIVILCLLFGIGSYIYKPTTEEVNCWYYFNDDKTYNVLFAETPDRTFEVELSSDELKKQVKKEALQYKEQIGYYCPETKVRVITCFGKIKSAKIMSFRNSEINKVVNFDNPTKIPLEKVKGKLDILKPSLLRIWS